MIKLTRIYAGEGDLQTISDYTYEAIVRANTPPVLFRNGDRIVRIERDDAGSYTIRDVTEPRLIHHISRICSFYKMRNEEEKPARPPKDLARDILARPDKAELPLLRRISPIPLFAPDGSLFTAEGYDPRSQIYFALGSLAAHLDISPHPEEFEIDAARDFILSELFADFPFVSPAARAHAMAALLQPFVRLMIDGPTPLYLIEKPTPGTGGSLLARVICYLVLGTFPSTTTQPRTEVEWRYALFSWLRDCPSVVLIDNVNTPLESGALASAITDVRLKDRVIGTSDAVSVPIDCMWLATANNPVLSTEIARRVVQIRLDAGMQHPDLRNDFRHPNLVRWVVESREEILWAVLTLIQAWVAKGQPAGNEIPLGGFESWSRVMGGILRVAQVEGFLSNRQEVRAMADRETGLLLPFVDSWWGRYRDAPVGVAELWDLASELDLGGGTDQARRIKLGRRLDSLRDRRLGDYRVQKCGPYQGAQRYRLQWETGGSQ